MVEAGSRGVKGRPRTKTLAWRDADEAALRRLRTGVGPRRLLVLLSLLAAAGAFLWQTHRWDVSDDILQQIERASSSTS